MFGRHIELGIKINRMFRIRVLVNRINLLNKFAILLNNPMCLRKVFSRTQQWFHCGTFREQIELRLLLRRIRHFKNFLFFLLIN